ncbi:hypothetical protein [Flindersiella endophytica]
MARDLLARIARNRTIYTGETYMMARQEASQLGQGAPIIPSTRADQAQFESLIFEKLAWPKLLTIYPFGIRRVRPRTDSLLIELESDAMVSQAVQALLPASAEGHDVYGVPGLRFRQVDERSIELYRAGTTTSVLLAGFEPWVWHQAAKEYEASVAEMGLEAYWPVSTDTFVDYEAEFDQRYEKPYEGSAWLGSGLLRRTRLIIAVGRHVRTTAWANAATRGTTWCIEMEHDLGERIDHGEYARALALPNLGLPVEVSRVWCHCDKERPYCVVDLDGTNGHLGRVNLRFIQYADRFSDYDKQPDPIQSIKNLWAKDRQRLPG